MAYRIEYKQGVAQKTAVLHKLPQMRKILIAIIAGMCILFLSEYCHGLCDVFVPGNPAVTKAAASEFISEIKRGSGIADALVVFCHEVIIGADIPYAH